MSGSILGKRPRTASNLPQEGLPQQPPRQEASASTGQRVQHARTAGHRTCLKLQLTSLCEKQPPPSALQAAHGVLTDTLRSEQSKIHYLSGHPSLHRSRDPDLQWWTRHLQHRECELALGSPVAPRDHPAPLGPDEPGLWQELHAEACSFPRLIRHGIEGAPVQESLAQVARWLDKFLAALESTPALRVPGRQPHPGADLLCLIWEREIAPRVPTLLSERETGLSLQLQLHRFLLAALHPAVLPRRQQASVAWIRRVGDWCTALCLSVDHATGLLNQALPKVAGPDAKAALVDMLLPSLRAGPFTSQRSLMPILKTVLDPALLHELGRHAAEWIREMHRLLQPMRLAPQHGLNLLQTGVPGRSRDEVEALMTWLWPFVHDEAFGTGRSHEAWEWLAWSQEAFDVVTRLPQQLADECFKMLPARAGSQPRHDARQLAEAMRSGDPDGPPPDELDLAVWEGRQQGSLLDFITSYLGKRSRLPAFEHRVRASVFACPPRPGEDGVRWASMKDLLGPKLYDELLKTLDEPGGPTEVPPAAARTQPTTDTNPESVLIEAVQDALDTVADGHVVQLIRRGVCGDELLHEMLKRCGTGCVSAAQLQRWVNGSFTVATPGQASRTRSLREILGDYQHDILKAVLLGS